MPPTEFFGPYRIGEMLGRGGMGNVYAAKHETSGERVAVKLIAGHVADEPRFRRRFEREIHALKLLKHPGIVRLVGYGEEAGQLFYSMELVEGETLQARIRREKRISWLETIDLSIQICAALKHAHDIGVKHRDLKPANLMLTPEGQIKLVDFGIPKNFFDRSDETAAGSILGTPDYMAPEQATGGEITERTDLYQLGSVMYAMLTGRSPFKGKNATAVIEAVKRDRPIPLTMLEDDMPEALSELVHQLLEKAPADRPPTALVVMNRLKAMRADLQREQTQLEDNAKTHLTHEFVAPLSTSEVDVDAINPSGPTNARPRTVVSRGGTGGAGRGGNKKAPSPRSPHGSDVTVASQLVQTQATGPGRSPNAPQPNEAIDNEAETVRTHFETIDEETSKPSLLAEHDAENWSSSRLATAMTLTAMLAVLALGGWAVMKAVTPPTADELYQTAITQKDTQAAHVFLKYFPEDPRSEELKEMQIQRRLQATLNRLTARAKIGLKPLDAAQSSFLAMMQGRETDPAEALERMGQWMAVFGDAQDGSPVCELVELTLHEQQRLASEGLSPKVDPRAVPLMDDLRSVIQKGIQKGDTQTTQKKLTGIVDTFSDAPWAKPVVDAAKAWLKENANESQHVEHELTPSS